MTTTIPARPPFDPELAAALAVINENLPPAFTAEMLPALREGMAERRATDEELSLGGAFVVEERLVPGPAGAPDISLVIARPAAARTPVGVLYTIHGGGMILGHNRSQELPELLGWARELELAVVSVDYRLAPEHPHPAPVEDCYAGLVWVVENAAELGLDPERVVIAGGSAGGGLAASTVLLARDRGGPALAGQMLLCPMIDDRNDTPSAHQMVGVGVWDQASNELGWTSLLGDARGGPDVSPYAAAARATDLSGLPPAFLDVGSAETFRDEVVTYASRLWQAGGQAELHVWPGGFHGFDMLASHAALSQAAKAQRLPWLRRLLGS
jgi:acetyl esterase/lipase